MINFFIFIIGLFFGSFFGVIIDRLESGESFIVGRSKCDFCKKDLSFLDLIPVLSFIFSKGKCRYCKKKISKTYPLIELFTGFIFVLANIYSPLLNMNGNLNFYFFYYLFIFSLFLILFFQDIKYGILSDKIILLIAGVETVFILLFSRDLLINNISSALGSFLFFLLVSLLFFFLTKKQGMGGGDIKLSFVLGLTLGFPNILVSLYLAFLTGAFYSIILILWRKKDYLKDSLPFGPFLIASALISLIWGNLIYLHVLNFLGI